MGIGDRVRRAEQEVGGPNLRSWLKGWNNDPLPITDPYQYNNDIIRDAENYMAREVGGPDLRRFRMGGGLETWEPRGGIPWENLPPPTGLGKMGGQISPPPTMFRARSATPREPTMFSAQSATPREPSPLDWLLDLLLRPRG
jgi:hypothetical protein